MRASIGRRLLVGTSAGVAIVLAIAGVLVHVMARRSLYEQFDTALATDAQAIAQLVEQDGQAIEIEGTPLEYFEVRDEGGRVLAASKLLGDGRLSVRGAEPIEAVVLPDGRAARAVTLPFVPRLEEGSTAQVHPVTLVFARPVGELEESIARIDAVLFGVAVSATMLCLVLIVAMARFGLAPVRRVATAIAGVREDKLALAVADVPVELAPIVERLHELLRRLDAAFARERELTAEVAHELRTPLAGLRATIEVALDRERDAERYRAALAACLAICTQTERVVEALLSLAKLDAGTVAVRVERVELDELVRDVIAPVQPRVAGLTTQLAPVTVDTDREKLRVVVQNLVDNAAEYGDGNVHVEVIAPATVRVTNTGCTLASAEHVFERFWRGDAARTAGGAGHVGLGLALSKKLVELLGGEITATCTDGRFVATVVVTGTSSSVVDRSWGGD